MQGAFQFGVEDRVKVDRLDPLPELRDARQVVVDFETTNELWVFDRHPVGLAYLVPGGPTGYAAFGHPGGGNYSEARVKEWAQKELSGKEVICASAKHECDTFHRWGVDLEGKVRWMDVFHQAALLNETRRRTNLDLLGREELNRGKVPLLGNAPIHERSAAEIEAYAGAKGDCGLTWDLYNVYKPRIEAEDLTRVLDLENELVWSTCEMERNGSYIDLEKLCSWEPEVAQELEARILRLYHETGLRVNPSSPDDLSRLFKHCGLQNLHVTEGDNESFTEEILLEYDDDPRIALVIEARQLKSLQSKLKQYKASVKPDGRLFYCLHQLRCDDGGTITGRYSSAKMYKAPDGGINIQQVMATSKMPKLLQRWPIRQLFIAPPGRVYFSADASQIEFRVMSHYAAILGVGRRLAEAYQKDDKTDFHALVVLWTGLVRGFAKNVSFCRMYGGGTRKVAWMCKIAYEEAEKIVKKYDHEFPEPNRLIKMAENQAKRIGYVRTFLGRRRRYQLNSESERYYSAMNAVFQGGAADLMKLKIARLYRERKTLGLTMRSTVHDEKNGDLSDKESLSAADEVMRVQEFPLEVPIRWDAKVGANWNECH